MSSQPRTSAGPLPDVGETVEQRVVRVARALRLELRAVEAIRRRPRERLQFREAGRAGQRALGILAHRSPRRLLIDVAFAPEVLEQAVAHLAFRRRGRFQMPHVHAERVEQPVLIGVADVGEQPVHRRRFGPEIARRAIGLFVPQRGEDAFA